MVKLPPFRSSIEESAKLAEAQNIVYGAINAFSAIGGNLTGLYNLVTGNFASAKPKTIRPEDSVNGPTSTGYYQALKLQQFLEQYAEAKKQWNRKHPEYFVNWRNILGTENNG